MNESGMVLSIQHVQVTAPRAKEEQAKAFYGGTLGLQEVAKPDSLAGRGGAWYQCGVQQLHLGVEDDFRPQRKGHPAFLVDDLAAMRTRLEAAGAPITVDAQIPGYERFESRDPCGNRLEFLARTQTEDTEDTEDTQQAGEIKARVRAMFGRAAEAYVTSATHADGDDLQRLVELAAPQPTDRALDISTGGGHVARALAPYVERMTASDLTPRMLAAASAFITGQGYTNVDFVVADAEQLPFLADTFALVTVRIAPHHYADIRRAVREMARVLRPNGRLIIIDNIAPADPALDALVNRWDTVRDPSHVREYTIAEWQTFLSEAGLRITDREVQRKTHPFAAWVERMQMPDEARRSLEAEMLNASPEAQHYFAISEREGHVETWSSEFALFRAVKEQGYGAAISRKPAINASFHVEKQRQ